MNWRMSETVAEDVVVAAAEGEREEVRDKVSAR